MKGKLVILGLDGADWRIVEPLIKRGCLPNFATALERGSYGGLKSTIPALTPPAWTSMFTGANPGKHGIFDFIHFEDNNVKHTSSRDVQLPYVWELMGEHKVIGFNIPTSYPPRSTKNALLVSGFPAPGEDAGDEFTWPKQLKKEIKQLIPDYQIGLKDKAHLLSDGKIADKGIFSRLVMKNLENKIKLAKYLLENKEWDTAIVAFSATDWIQHLFMHEFVKHEKCKTDVAKVYKSIDGFLGYLIKKEYNIMIVSDHGFQESKKKFFLNTYLKDKGYIKLRNENPLRSIMRKTGISKELIFRWPFNALYRKLIRTESILDIGRKVLPTGNMMDARDMEKTRMFLFSSSGGVYVNPKEDVYEIKNILEDCTDEKGNRMIIKAVLRESEYFGKNSHKAPVITLIPAEGVELQEKLSEDTTKKVDPRVEKNGIHDMEGIFMACGPDLIGKGRIDGLQVSDIAPTMLSYFGYSIPTYMDGKTIPLFDIPEKGKSTFGYETRSSIKKLLRKNKKIRI